MKDDNYDSVNKKKIISNIGIIALFIVALTLVIVFPTVIKNKLQKEIDYAFNNPPTDVEVEKMLAKSFDYNIMVIGVDSVDRLMYYYVIIGEDHYVLKYEFTDGKWILTDFREQGIII